MSQHCKVELEIRRVLYQMRNHMFKSITHLPYYWHTLSQGDLQSSQAGCIFPYFQAVFEGKVLGGWIGLPASCGSTLRFTSESKENRVSLTRAQSWWLSSPRALTHDSPVAIKCITISQVTIMCGWCQRPLLQLLVSLLCGLFCLSEQASLP